MTCSSDPVDRRPPAWLCPLAVEPNQTRYEVRHTFHCRGVFGQLRLHQPDDADASVIEEDFSIVLGNSIDDLAAAPELRLDDLHGYRAIFEVIGDLIELSLSATPSEERETGERCDELGIGFMYADPADPTRPVSPGSM
ncbi:MAG: hypothetical protein AAGJ54_11050 [Planctomycetota bacterium]